MSVSDVFDKWAEEGRDRGMEERHWHKAKHALERMAVEAGDVVLDLGCGSGYAARALEAATDVSRVYGLDGSVQMARNARSYTTERTVSFLVGDFEWLPFESGSVDHVFSMEAFYYAADPLEALREVRRVLGSGGTFYCAVDYVADNPHTAEWDEYVDLEMTRWSRAEYREAFREAGLHVAGQDAIPDQEVEIPPADAFPIDEWDSREAMVEHYRTHGTLLTVGVVP